MSNNGPKLEQISEQIEFLAAAIKNHIETVVAEGDTTKILITYFRLKTDYDRLDDARKMIYALKDEMDKGHVPALFERLNQEMIRIPEVARSFYPTTKYSASIVGDKAAAYDWLRENGGSAIIQETVNAGTLTSFLKEKVIDENVEPPAELLTLKSYKTTGMSKYTPK